MEEILQLGHIVKRDKDTAPGKDRRRRCNVVVAAYFLKGEEYRKSFYSYGEPEVPKSGTHEELNSKKYQGF